MTQGSGAAPNVHPNFGQISGVNASGSPITVATMEAEACFRCHADNNTRQPLVTRRIVQNNTRVEFATGAVSFHPVLTSRNNLDVPSLRAPYTTSSIIYCSDCHGSDTGTNVGGSGANGIHGSNFRPMLNARYEMTDNTSESPAAYALCYRCHDRANILDDRSFKEHKKHIVEERTPCSVCHDGHGISSAQGNITNNSSLINFATGVVQPNSNGRLEFRDLGRFRGECNLRCHGENHNAEGY